jgi:hypothetical protein
LSCLSPRNCFVKIGFISFCIIPFRFDSVNFVSFRWISFRLGIFRFAFHRYPVLCYSLTIIYCCQVQNYIYWLISTENDHRHNHKFNKYEKRLRKEGNMLGLPINNNQALRIPWVRLIQRQRSNWSPTYILHLFHLEDTSLLFLFISESSRSAFFHALTVSLLPKNHMLIIVSKQCACSRRVHIEGHMNRFESCHPDNNSDNDSFGSFLSKNRIFCNITRC